VDRDRRPPLDCTARRIKAGKEHRVPLTAAAPALPGDSDKPGKVAFQSERKPGKPLSDRTLLAVLHRMGLNEMTGHRLRSSLRDWAGETTAHPRELIEAALAHQLKDKAEVAYALGDLFTKRRLLMAGWALFLPGAS
jgi:integrase